MNFSYYQTFVNWQVGFFVTSNQKYPHSETMKLITLSKQIITSKIVVFHFRQRGETHERFRKFTLLDLLFCSPLEKGTQNSFCLGVRVGHYFKKLTPSKM